MKEVHEAPRGGAKYRAKRECILLTALDLFRSKGYDATSLQDVADASGLLKGSLYYYFRSKEDLLVEVAEMVHESFTTSLEGLKSLDGSVLERIRRLLYRTAYNAGNNQKILSIFYREFQRIDGVKRERIVALRDEHEGFLRSLIVEGQEQGAVRRNLSPKIASIMLETMATNVYLWYKSGHELALEEIADELADLAVHSLRAS